MDSNGRLIKIEGEPAKYKMELDKSKTGVAESAFIHKSLLRFLFAAPLPRE